MDKKGKTLFVINKHSFIDVITNSSTELFVMDKDKSDEFLNNVLNEILTEYNLDKSDITVRGLNGKEKLFSKYNRLGKVKAERGDYSFTEYRLYLEDLEKEDLELIKNSNVLYITTNEKGKEYISSYRNYTSYLDEDSIIIECDDGVVGFDALDDIESYSSCRIHMG